MRWSGGGTPGVVMMAMLATLDARAVDVAVLPIAGVGPADERAALTDRLRAEVAGLGIDVLSSAQTALVLDNAAALGVSCAVTVSSCATQLGGVAGVDRVVVGAVDGGLLTVRVLDVASEREGGRVSMSLAAPSALRHAAVRLLKPSLDVGRLAIDVDIAGAAIAIDGGLRGTSPLPPMTLSSGRHEVFVSHVDHESQAFVIDIVFDQTATLDVVLAPGRARRRTSTEVGGAGGPVVVLDVLTRPASPLTSVVVTNGLADTLRRSGDRMVATPTDLYRLLGEPGLAALRSCDDDECLAASLEPMVGDGDVVVADVIDAGSAMVITARRVSTTGEAIAAASATLEPRQSLAAALQGLVGQLFPEARVAGGDPGVLDQRLAPPPLHVAWFGTAAAVGAVASVGAGVALVQAAVLDAAGAPDVAGTVAAVGVGTAAVAGVALAGAIATAPFTDWAGVQADNEALLQEAAARPASRRHPR